MSCENRISPFFSVAIPVYNGEKYIGQCIDSILGQTFRDIEVVVVNDGSTDRTGEILSDICKKDERVKVVTLENGGVFRARAYGAARSRGTYLTYCDDDDVFADSRAFEKLYEKAKGEEYELIQCGYYKQFRHFKAKDNTVKKETVSDERDFYERDYPYLLSSRNIDSRLMLNTVTKLYHRSLYQNSPDPDSLERLFMGDDLVINLYFLEGCRSALFLPDAYYLSYRLRGNSGSYRRDEMHNLNVIKDYQKRFLDRWSGEKKREVERLHHFETADWFFVHTVRSLAAIGEEQTRALVEEVVALPAFVRAREYFAEHPENNLPVSLLLSGDADEYIKAAKSDRGGSAKTKIYNFIKEKIIYKI